MTQFEITGSKGLRAIKNICVVIATVVVFVTITGCVGARNTRVSSETAVSEELPNTNTASDQSATDNSPEEAAVIEKELVESAREFGRDYVIDIQNLETVNDIYVVDGPPLSKEEALETETLHLQKFVSPDEEGYEKELERIQIFLGQGDNSEIKYYFKYHVSYKDGDEYTRAFCVYSTADDPKSPEWNIQH